METKSLFYDLVLRDNHVLSIDMISDAVPGSGSLLSLIPATFNNIFTKFSGIEIFAFISGLLLLVSVILIWRIIRYQYESKYRDKVFIEEEYLSEKSLLYTLIDNLPDFVYIKDENSRFIVANRKLARTVGKESGYELIGKTDHDFYPAQMADEFRRNEIEVMVTDTPILFKVEKGIDENGKPIYVSTSKIPFHDKDGKVIGIVGIGRDISDSVKIRDELEARNRDLNEINILLKEKQEEILDHEEQLKISAEKLLEEKNLLRTLIDNMPDRIYIKDRRSRFITGNLYLSKILNVKSPDELTGKTDFDFHPRELAEEFYRDEQHIMATGVPLIGKEERSKDLQGQDAIVSTTKAPVRDEFGQVIGIVGIGREITKYKQTEHKLLEEQANLKEINILLKEHHEKVQQQAEKLKLQSENILSVTEELEKLSMVASKTDNTIIIMDADGNFEWVNKGFETKTGMNLEEYVSAKGGNLRQNSSFPDIDNILSEVITLRESRTYSSPGKSKSGKTIWSQTSISPVLNENNEIIRLILIDTDITKLKEAEDEINRQRIDMEKQRDELKIINATKDRFFSIIGHDLKNPFNAIMGFSDLLTRNFDDIDDQHKKEFIALIKDSSTSAYELLENLLSWARTQTNQISYEPGPVSVKNLVNQNFQILDLAARNKNIRLSENIPSDLRVTADQNMLKTILRNLLTNAIKFTPGNGNVSVSASVSKGMAKINVRDDGIGMDEETISKVLKVYDFHNSQGTAGETGTGLGLLVCREFISKHGSNLSIKSLKGKGSTFSFSLPIAV